MNNPNRSTGTGLPPSLWRREVLHISKLNTIAPFGAACHSIVYAAEQAEQAEPKAVMGLFDISQRSAALKDLLSLTLPYQMWQRLSEDSDRNCLTTHSWKAIEPRL